MCCIYGVTLKLFCCCCRERREAEARLEKREREANMERERLEKQRAEQAVHKHFEESFRLAQQKVSQPLLYCLFFSSPRVFLMTSGLWVRVFWSSVSNRCSTRKRESRPSIMRPSSLTFCMTRKIGSFQAYHTPITRTTGHLFILPVRNSRIVFVASSDC